MSDYAIDPQTIVDFWRDEVGRDRWFAADPGLDGEIRRRFGDIAERAALGGLDRWAEDPNGALALVILLDQFPRNMFRGSPKAFATDGKALEIARAALERGDHYLVGEDVNQFLAMPLMHSEVLADQDAAVAWMAEIGEGDDLLYAERHRDVVARFGRFPHRNPILGRTSTPEERAYLGTGGFAG